MGANQDGQGFMSALTSSPVGVGVVLVFLPSLALFVGLKHLESVRLIGLPLLAIFGIVILFGTLALVAMFFKHLGLEDKGQPLALPEGSIRAAIALSLIVLFAIIAIMLFQGMDGKPFKLEQLTLEQRNALVAKPGMQVNEVEEACAVVQAAGAACAEADRRFTVLVRVSPGADSVDMAKQLMVLVGTLMTSVTSYYFAARSSSSIERGAAALHAASAAGGQGGGAAMAGAAAASTADEHLDGCNVAITEATPDQDLPPARGGVAPLGG